MKKIIFLLCIAASAAPAAWGLYLAQHPPGEDPALRAFPAAAKENPVMEALQAVNDGGVALKRRINAYLYREQRAAMARTVKRCLPAIGGGYYARHTGLIPGVLPTVVGEVVNLSGADARVAKFRVTVYGRTGEPAGTAVTYLRDFRAGETRRVKAVLGFPIPDSARARLTFAAPEGALRAPAVGNHYCGLKALTASG